ncbi:MAG TPA: STAS domain-containing protein [Dongiaceae bacterium]|jgi:rsbT co-antagonist protein RsbR
MKATTTIPQLIDKNQKQLLAEWIDQQADGSGEEQRNLSQRFIAALKDGLQSGQLAEIGTEKWASTRAILEEVSQQGVIRGDTPTQTATFVFSLKQPLFNLLRRELGKDTDKLAEEIWTATLILDKLGLYTTEYFQKSREQVILRQQQEMLELSTPVVKLWEGILALPLIGTLDSARTQVVMENLLQEIMTTGADIAIIDITGVPTVDTLVAQHLLKTISAARLMGADCIISGIRPQIAQTMVHLGVELDVVSKATMADAFALALRRLGQSVASPVKAGKPA